MHVPDGLKTPTFAPGRTKRERALIETLLGYEALIEVLLRSNKAFRKQVAAYKGLLRKGIVIRLDKRKR